jgi:NAD+ kinase
MSVKRAMLITPTNPERSSDAVATASEVARAAGVQLVSTPDEHQKHLDAATHIENVVDGEKPDVCLVLGGDGLAAVERDQLAQGLERAFSGDYEVMDMPALTVDLPVEHPVALNDVSFQRQAHGRVAELSYTIGDEEVGSVRCDGLVAATPAGSTGYNLANNGPILAWGVKGFVVSFIAPHTLAARALVVAPGDPLLVRNAAGREPVEISLDGASAGELQPGAELEMRFEESVSKLAQLPGSNFYHRIREKFGKLA